MKLILASASPRRAELLRQIGLDFTVRVPQVEESLNPRKSLGKELSYLACRKARYAAEELGQGLVIGADTIVLLGKEVLGKPGSVDEAREMLGRLSGKMHQVWTGVAIVDAAGGRSLTGVEKTRVYFRQLSPEMIESYIASGEPWDKAGAYGIQGKAGVLVKRIVGCYYNVVGLPLPRVAEMLEQLGAPVHQGWGKEHRLEGR